MHFLLSSISVVYVLTTPIPKDGENATVEQIRMKAKWDNDDYVFSGLILNAKSMAENASSKKFLVSNFTNHKMTDSRPVMKQYNVLLGILGRFTQHKMNMDEAIQVSCIIDPREVEDAMLSFYEVPRTSSVPWNVVISCLGIHGHGEKSLQLFRNMLDERVQPDTITFISLLSACSHSGLVEQGACRIYGNTDLDKVASNKLLEVDPDNVGYYVLISNIYATAGKWEGVDNVRSLADSKGLKKNPGWSYIELNNKMEVFYIGNYSHPQCDKIYEKLDELLGKMKILGYVSDYSFVLQDVEEDEKQHILTSHNERLEIVSGILNTPPKTTIRILG
ncbi:pentatricopeptide repeat-containing protein [Tanacetum coccineum]|uniref:Pentatricopeptide repeat-containing protein n=1 Tax=Tanacetum coccineum TaxID=301880 RepID=A0ABQ5ANR7_9ASTR